MLTEAQLEDAREDVAATLWDTCTLHYAVEPTGSELDSFGQPKGTVTASAALACGVEFKPAREPILLPSGEAVVLDARIRLPLGTVLESKDQVWVTHLQTEALAEAMVFEVVGTPRPGRLLLVADLRRPD